MSFDGTHKSNDILENRFCFRVKIHKLSCSKNIGPHFSNLNLAIFVIQIKSPYLTKVAPKVGCHFTVGL